MGSVNKVIWKTFKNAQENTCDKAFFKIYPANLLRKGLKDICFPVNLVKFLEIAFLTTNLLFRRNIVYKSYPNFHCLSLSYCLLCSAVFSTTTFIDLETK